MSYLIKDLPEEEKPREKAKIYGIESLSEAELLAILLRTGAKQKSVKDLSLQILEKIEQIGGYTSVRLPALLEINGVGETKAVTILAMIELAKRISRKEIRKKLQIKESKDVWHYYKDYFVGETQEKFLVLFLDSKNYILNEKVLFTGTANQSIVHPRDIFREAILNNAVKILCIHNHPTGIPSPSKEDNQTTVRLKESGEMLGIPLIDHVIIGDQTYFSYLEQEAIQ